jgi:hypothetical protein
MQRVNIPEATDFPVGAEVCVIIAILSSAWIRFAAAWFI